MYQYITRFFGIAALVVAFCGGNDAFADAQEEPPATQEEHKNMKVIHHTGRSFKKTMKNFSKGVGVKCTACHVKREFDSENKAMKDKSRAFFRKVVGNKDDAQRKEALADLLKLLKVDKVKDEARMWKAIDKMTKKNI